LEQQKEALEKRRATAKARRVLGFVDVQVDENGNTILAEEGDGVTDKQWDDYLTVKKKYDTKVEENRARKKIDIVTPVLGISKQEYLDGMLRSDEYFKEMDGK